MLVVALVAMQAEAFSWSRLLDNGQDVAKAICEINPNADGCEYAKYLSLVDMFRRM
ncbi:hypothetical protein NP493_940g00031 [Ridgeia piscesae]|uniref:Uncharacterized protein n=1 Tax=Ridgeia piscesae TaxID=27915 RepID=A0AAD9NLH5_RIDPI|nr:hypothetical protein NP493_940g00031 [Ridgeia piscesae]